MSTPLPVLEPAGPVGVLEREVETTDSTEEGKVAHIVLPASAVTEAYILGTPVTALCGHTWVPSRNPEPLPRCQGCMDAYDFIRQMQGKSPREWS